MATKLTLRMDEKLIAKAKRYAKHSGKSISQLVADYFALLGTSKEDDANRLSPGVKELKGCLSSASIKEEDYKKHLEEKYL